MNQENQPGLPGDTCFSCDRFIGPADTCPYCGVDSARPPVLKRLRIVALFLALVGLLYLYLAAARTEPGLMKVGDISPAMNFGVVRVKGTVTRDAYVGRNGGETNYVSFIVADGTGEIQVRAYRDVARALALRGLPPKGQGVTADGTLRVSAKGKVRLVLQGASQLQRDMEQGQE